MERGGSLTDLSIVVPALDEAAGIASALARLGPLRALGAEVVVVDGGSTDRTAEIARDHADRVLASRRGRAWQMNAGAAAARGAVILFLHADTTLPDAAAAALHDFVARGDPSWGRFDVRIAGRPRLLAVVAHMMNLRSRWTGIATGDQAIFVRRAAFETVGGYPAIPLMEDIALSRALKRLSRPLCLRDRVTTSGRRWEKHGVLRTILLMWRLRLAYWRGVDTWTLARRYGIDPGPRDRRDPG
ncbi:TIGR04283 family arsenosugar biosynthesis glycosyltransferase [Rhodoplanes sp. SY1]|uniref:TIGR04283 family arsenosugar biosynthesis glycosyltransferase n=1 Tax=Rhodoplanes sp. SY1 TaxID=3166646 RepID=UPI0038B629D8